MMPAHMAMLDKASDNEQVAEAITDQLVDDEPESECFHAYMTICITREPPIF